MNAIKFSSTGDFLVTGDNLNRVVIWSLPEFKEAEVYKGHFKQVTALCLLENRGLILSGSKDSTMRLWTIGD